MFTSHFIRGRVSRPNETLKMVLDYGFLVRHHRRQWKSMTKANCIAARTITTKLMLCCKVSSNENNYSQRFIRFNFQFCCLWVIQCMEKMFKWNVMQSTISIYCVECSEHIIPSTWMMRAAFLWQKSTMRNNFKSYEMHYLILIWSYYHYLWLLRVGDIV